MIAPQRSLSFMDFVPRTLAPEFRAPPPSPAAVSRSSEEDDEFGGFLTRSARVPELILPDRILGRGSAPWNPPEIDFRSLISNSGGTEVDDLRSAAASMGCFKIVNHGIPKEAIEGLAVLAGELFRLPPERKREVTVSPERNWGFELEDEEEEEGDIFWWGGGREDELAGISPRGYKDISSKLECLRRKMEKIAGKIRMLLLQHINAADAEMPEMHSARRKVTADSSALFFYKNPRSKSREVEGSLLNDHEILRMLIRSSVLSISLSLHICRGASSFRVYSKKKGCIHFPVTDQAIVVTVGEQMQVWSNELYKHVAGKPIFENEIDFKDSISMALHYSDPATRNTCNYTSGNKERSIISLTEQVMIAAFLILLYHIIVFIHIH